ncbi:Ger(x)C family spore germination protein [Paenibacillus sp. Soil787]|uniref:Ger(x)C family spore germination protein n=1 Tax=Paenibacillus sp. Soil787 TaxID=1736411 RepID=UPI0007019258|nr:Ger(x)C family spore germination protein [Paenibacillus sp. Soil787]KRF43655.1 hypothetical protein ASG93_01670 [Paenibacillus sp. Soil787]
MKRCLSMLLLLILAVVLSGCYDRIEIEDVTFALSLGIDLDQNNNLIIYETSPVFSKEAKKKKDEFHTKANSIRQARGKLDAGTLGSVLGGKIQEILVSRRVLQHKDWFTLLDLFYRDPKLTVNASVVEVDGPLEDLFKSNPSDKPRLSLALTQMIDTGDKRSETVKTTLQDLHRQMLDKGITPAITELQTGPGSELMIHGTALLDEEGKYVTSLKLQENILLRILQNQTKNGDLSLTVPIPGERKSDLFSQGQYLSFRANDTKTGIKSSYRQGKFHFDIHVKMNMVLLERLFPYDMRKEPENLERMVEKQVNIELENLLKKFQKHKIDPIGLGLYARAFQYSSYEKVQDHWGEALANADINVSTKITLKSMGAIK